VGGLLGGLDVVSADRSVTDFPRLDVWGAMRPYSEDRRLGARQREFRTLRCRFVSTPSRFAVSSHSKAFRPFAESLAVAIEIH